MQKRYTMFFAAAALSALIMAGCADKSTKVSETPGNAPGATQEQAKSGEQKAKVVEETPKTSGEQSKSYATAAESRDTSKSGAAADGTSSQKSAAAEAKVEPKVTAAAAQTPAQQAAAASAFGLQTIYFEYDKSRITPEAQSVLDKDFEALNKNSKTKALIVGHCDERGTNEYNMALGDRRANSTKSYLVNRGISSARLDTLSKGEEEPADPGHDETAWAKNRRAQFIDR